MRVGATQTQEEEEADDFTVLLSKRNNDSVDDFKYTVGKCFLLILNRQWITFFHLDQLWTTFFFLVSSWRTRTFPSPWLLFQAMSWSFKTDMQVLPQLLRPRQEHTQWIISQKTKWVLHKEFPEDVNISRRCIMECLGHTCGWEVKAYHTTAIAVSQNVYLLKEFYRCP